MPMYLMYIDESGDPGLHSGSPTDYFILTGIIFHELKWRPILDDLIQFRRRLRTATTLKLREEIHSVKFISSPGALMRIKRNDRLDILKQCLDWVANQPDINIITVSVHKVGKPHGYDVFNNAWEALIQRFENTIRHYNFPGPKNPDDRGLILPDNTNGEKLTKLLRRMRRFNPIPSIYGTGSRNIAVNYIIEDPFMKDSQHSFFHQIADVVAYFAMQHYKPNSYVRKMGARTFYTRLDSVLCKVASKKNTLGLVEL